MRFTARTANPAIQMRASSAQYRKDLRRAAILATDRASRDAQREVQSKIRSVGLGRLANAVGQTSMLKEGKSGSANDRPYGTFFARGGDDSQAGGALESYSRGANIEPAGGNRWLWIPTAAVPKFVVLAGRRFRTTPALYKLSGYTTSIGKLEFRPIGPNRALYVIKRVSLSPKTGRAKAQTGRRTRTRINQKEVIAFIGIRFTRRAQKFDKDTIALAYARRMPIYLRDALAEVRGRRA